MSTNSEKIFNAVILSVVITATVFYIIYLHKENEKLFGELDYFKDRDRLLNDPFHDKISENVEKTISSEKNIITDNSYTASKERIKYMKSFFENEDGYKLLYVEGKPVKNETDLHRLYKLTWYKSNFDVNREVDNGRGAVDFKVSKGALDKTLIEFKLASNPSLKKNLLKQLEIYAKADGSKSSKIWVIFYFNKKEHEKTVKILTEIDKIDDKDIVLINVGNRDKISASKA